MFSMKCSLSIASVNNNEPVIRAIKPSAVSVKKSVTDIVDTAEITLPLNPYLQQDNTDGTLLQQRNIVFNTGDKVRITMGYDDDTTERFAGFIARIDKTVPMRIYCEGYAFLLRDVVFNRSYTSVTLKQLLADLVSGTEIRISPYTADVTIPNVFFKNTPALKVLEWVQKELLCRVWFDDSELYAGTSLFTLPKPTTQFRLGYNTIKDDALQRIEQTNRVQITIVEKQKTGSTKKVKDATKKYDATKEIRIRPGMPDFVKNQIATELQKVANHQGFSGKITTFLVPRVDKAYTVEITDNRYPERAGRYFAETVETSFSPSGGRQTIKLSYYGK